MLFHTATFIRKYVYLSLGFFDRAILRQENDIFILSYHSVARDSWRFSVDPLEIKKQIDYLSRHFDFITLEDLHKYTLGKKKIIRPSVAITFDDGYKDVLQLREYFNKKHIRPALFVLANTTSPNWKELATKRAFLTKEDIRSLVKDNWEIGNHSATHANLATLSSAEIAEEVIASKQKLEKDLGIPIRYFAYPRGKYSSEVLAAVKKAKYILGLTMDDGFITTKSDLLTLPRIGIDRTHSFAEFRSAFSPSVVKVRQLIKRTLFAKYL